MLYFPDQQALFIHIPKTGGEFVVHVCQEVLKLNCVAPHCKPQGGKHCPPWMVEEPVRYSFAFVRQPEEWFRSMYAFACGWIARTGAYPIAWEPARWHAQRFFDGFPREVFSSFSDFVVAVYEREPAYVTRMFEWFVGPAGGHQVSFIGRQENLGVDLQRGLSLAGINVAVADITSCQRKNVSRSSGVVIPEDMQRLIRKNELSAMRRFYPAVR